MYDFVCPELFCCVSHYCDIMMWEVIKMRMKHFIILQRLHRARKHGKLLAADSLITDTLPHDAISYLIKQGYAYYVEDVQVVGFAEERIPRYIVITEEGITAKSQAFWKAVMIFSTVAAVIVGAIGLFL